MTHLNQRRTKLVFTSADTIREAGKYREVVIDAHPMFARVKLKGMHTTYEVSWSAIWSMAAKAEANRLAADRKARKGK